MANDRIYQNEDGRWYFRARGNADVGPFESETEASAALEKRVSAWAGRGSAKISWPREWHPGRIFRRSAPPQS